MYVYFFFWKNPSLAFVYEVYVCTYMVYLYVHVRYICVYMSSM